MAHTNQTPNYGLSEFVGSDKPAWLIDYNGDMEKIDLGIKAAQDVADAAKTEADQGAIDIAAVTITANSADAKAAGAVSDFADAYDSTSTYNVGDFVIYNNILYRCITAITVPESFDGTHWTRTTVEEIITQINRDLSSLTSSTLAVLGSEVSAVYWNSVEYGKHIARAFISADLVQIDSAGYHYFSIPNITRPAAVQPVIGVNRNGGGARQFTIGTDGIIRNAEAIPAGTYYFEMVWLF
jgi:hypothetical protein